MNNLYFTAGITAMLILPFSQAALAADSMTYQENEPGFCSADGDAQETKNAGYTGSGYVNVNNDSGTAITWSVEAENSGTFTIAFRYANGGTTSRGGTLKIDDIEYTVDMPSTGSWTTWQSATIQVYLSQGQNSISLIATSSSGLANIDSMTVSGDTTTAGSCESNSPTHPSYESDLVTGCDGNASGLSADKIYYVAPDGTSSGNGNSFNNAMNFSTALSKVKAGEMILLEPGTYTVSYSSGNKNTINFSKSGKSGDPIYVVAANCEKAVFDFSFPEQAWVQDSYGFYVTGDYWYFKGIEITRAGYQGAYVTGEHNTFENCAFHHNRNTGLEINKGGAYTTVINSDAYMNYDPKKRTAVWPTALALNKNKAQETLFYGCRAWLNSDDGFDTFDSPQSVIIDQSWAFRNGVDVWGYGNFSGNGNGFKLGGNRAQQNNKITRSVAFENVVKGFDQNNNAGGITVINNISYKNGINYGFGNSLNSGQQHYFRNNVSLSNKGSDTISNANASFNSWDSSVNASTSDFISLDLNAATVERNKDGTLPFTTLFRLAPGSDLIDAGANEGLEYEGNAPDLGAFERE